MRIKAIKEYFGKMFMLAPLTFLFAPFLYAMFGYHPDMALFSVFVYCLSALFIYTGMTVSFFLKKYVYLAYIIVVAAAFFIKDIVGLPIINSTKTVVFMLDEEQFLSGIPMSPDEIQWYVSIIFVAAALIGCAGVYYSKYSGLNFVSRGNTFLFVNINVIGALYYFFIGISETDKNAAGFYVFCLVSFYASYFLVRNFAMLKRQIEIYGERGAYNASGVHRVYGYYFATVVGVSAIPMVVFVAVVPYIINFTRTAIKSIALWLVSLLLSDEASEAPLPPLDFPDDGIDGEFMPGQSGNEMLVYYIFLFIFLILVAGAVVYFRKPIIAALKSLLKRAKLFDFDKNNIISAEITVKLPKDKNRITKYKNYLKKARKIRSLHDRYAFAYYCVFWSIIRLENGALKESMTPEEVAAYILSGEETREKYGEIAKLTPPYEDIKYGDIKGGENLQDMINLAEGLLMKIL